MGVPVKHPSLQLTPTTGTPGGTLCDESPTLVALFLSRLSKVPGVGVENPLDPPLRPFPLSNQILIVLNDAKAILDPKANDARSIYFVVDELCRLINFSSLREPPTEL